MSRETENLEKMGIDGVDHDQSEVGKKSDNKNGDNFNETILDPIVSTTKGRKKEKRFKSPVESINKPARRCKHCQKEGHDIRTCPKKRKNK